MRKYRTKSGKVEEKLPGIDATVSKSEKVQIAIAGGADTLKDVQTILGQEGKRNNLKGQGAKHLVSFYMGEGGYTGPGSPAAGDMSDDSGYDYTSEDTFPVNPRLPGEWRSGDPKGGPGVTKEELANMLTIPQLEEKDRLAGIKEPTYPYTNKVKGAIAAKSVQQTVPSKADLETESKDKATISPLSKPESKLDAMQLEYPASTSYKTFAERTDPDFWAKDEQTKLDKLDPDRNWAEKQYSKLTSFYNIPNLQKTAAASGVVNLAVGNLPGAFIDFANLAYQTSRKSTAKFDQDPIPGLTSKAAEEYADLYTSPPPDDPYSGGDDAPKKKKKKLFRAAANNTTLAVDDGDFTRKDIRRARRQITRFA